MPAGIAKQSRNTAISVSTILPRQFNHITDEALFILTAHRCMTLRGTMLAKNAASSTLGNAKPGTHLINTLATA
jgi:hypothetical protein